ncbi:WD repeat-containing protein 75 [Hyalella azteca]|uniref:WD repeat-containing protein 75 n=1 Tax=Hyalella azteca TaxID=294128 RepID=A0A8B7PF89_HYAAZ|nr:WD repeat-containing protein 75 [Hyalella azteca]
MTVDVEKIAVGGLCKEGGCMNYCRPQLIDFGRRAAIVCGKDIRIIDVAAGITDYVFAHHRSKVVGLASHLGSLYSCDDKSRIIVWDIDGRNVTIKKNLHFPVPALGVVEQLAHVYKNGSVAAVICFPSGERQLMMTDLENKFEQRDVLINNISPGANSFSFSKERDFCVGITYQGKFSAFEVVPTDRANVQNKSLLREHERKRRFLAQKRTFTCVAAHPSEKTVAAGDNYGGVEVYYNIFDSHYRTSRRLHLHGLAASDIAFSIDGSELYSCSLQGVLMRWSLRQGNLRQKQPLPQLNAPMTLLSIEGASLLATHTDNSFSLVDLVEYKLKNLFFGLGVSLSVREQISSPGQLALGTARDLKPDSVILSYDPRTQAVVTKSRPGHLHFYSSETKQQLFMVDVVSENFRMDAVTYRDVTHVTPALELAYEL